MACGGGLAGLAAAVTALYFVALYGFPALIRHLPRIGVAALLAADLEDMEGAFRQLR